MSVPYFNYSFDSETASLNVITNDIVSHDIPVTDGLYMRFEGKNYDEKTKTWYDSGGSGRHIPPSSITGTPYLSIQGSNTNGTYLRSFQVLKGDTTAIIKFGNPRLEEYTFFHIARYANASTNRKRIFWTTGMDSVYGFYNSHTGVAHHNSWITASSGNNYGTDFFIGCDCSNSYRTNGIERAITPQTTTFFGEGLGINIRSDEFSDFEIADIIIYNRYLSLDERIQMENYLASIYGITNAQNLLPVTTNLYARYEAKNYIPSAKIWYDSGSTRHITSGIGGSPTLITQGRNSNGATNIPFMVVKGGTGDSIPLGNDQLADYTLFFIARYNGGAKGRIFTTANGVNWLSGFHSSKAGVAYHTSWITQSVSDIYENNFFISTDCQNSYRANGVELVIANGNVTYLPAIKVNGWTSELSDFEIADIIIYNTVLPLADRIRVENYLASMYGISNVQPSLPVTTNLYMRFEAKNYNTSSKTWYDSGGSNRHIGSSSITGTPTVVTQTPNANGATSIPFMAVKGGTSEGIELGNDALTNYTIFFIARYSGATKARIISSFSKTGNGYNAQDWLSGHWNGYTGVAHHPGWLTSNVIDNHGSNFFISTDCQNSYRSNSIERNTTSVTGTTTLPANISVNAHFEKSDFEVVDIILYNAALTLIQRIQVEKYLSTIYGITISSMDTSNYLSQIVKLPPCRLGTNGVSFACWFRSLNSQTTNDTYARIFDFGISSSLLVLFIHGQQGKLGLNIPEAAVNLVIDNSPYVLDNTWRHVAWTISPDGTNKVYINGTLIYTNTNFFYPKNYDFTSNLIGKSNNSGDIFFNGAIDDFKFYKSTLTADEIYNLYDHNNTYPTITPTTSIPTPYLYYNFDPSGTMAGNLGTYLLNKGTPNQPVIPNTTFVRTNQWTTIENGPIIWTATGSSFMPSTTAIGGKTTIYGPFRAFDGSSNGGWVTAANTYNLQTSTIGDYKGATSTITTIGSVSTTINGEWIQIQSTVPVKMTSYKFESYYDNSNALACALPQTYYILGSNNGTSWDPIQYVVNNYASTNDASSNVNYTETFTITNNTTAITSGNYNTKGFKTIQGFSTSLNYYTYFRLSVNKVFGKRLGYTNIASTITGAANDFLAIGEWNIQFLPQYYYDATLGSSGLIQQSDYRIPNNQVMTNAKADQYIRLPTFSTDITGLTFTCWFRSNNNGTWARLFEFANSLLNDGNNNIVLFMNNSYIGNVINQYYYFILNTNIVPEINDNIWRHVAWTINTNGISTLYINGQSVFSQKAHYPFPISRTTNFLLKSNWNWDPSYNGAIDEFAMYKTVLSDTAINTIYDSTKSIFGIYNGGFYDNQIASTYVARPDLYYTFDSDTVRDQYLANKATGIYDTLMTKDTIIDSTDYKIENGSIALNGLPDTYVQLPKLSATGIDGLTFACWFRSNGNFDNTPIFDFGNGLVSDNISAKINRNNLTLSVNNGAISPFIYNPYFHYKFNVSDTNNYSLKNYGGGATDISGQYDAFIGVGASTIVDYATTKTFDISPNSWDAASSTWITKNNNNAFAVQWDVSASSIYAVVDYNDYHAFDTKIAGAQGWVSNGTTFGYAGTTGNVITNTYGIGTQWNTAISGLVENSISIVNLSGEWLEIKSSVPCSMKTYNLVSRNWPYEFPRTYYIFGSNDRITWYPIHYVTRSGGSGTSGTANAGYNNGIYTTPTYTIDTNSATQTNTTSGVLSTYNSYSTSLNTYEYFRILVRAIGGTNAGATYTSIGEWNINFTTSTTVAPPSINTILSTQNTQNESLILPGADNQKITLPAFTSGQDGLTFSFWMRSDSNTAGKTGAKIMDLGNDSKTDNITMSVQNDSLCCDVYNNGISSSVNSVLRLKPVFYYNFDDNTVNTTTVANLANGKLTQYGNSFSNPTESTLPYPMLANLYNGATVKGKVLTLSRTSATNSSSQFMKLPTMYLDSTKGVTMGCWFRTTDLSGSYQRLMTLGGDSSTTYQIGIAITPNRKLILFSSDSALRNWNPSTQFTINDGVWTHVMWTINGGTSSSSGATWKIYINGVFLNKNTSYWPTTAARIYNYIGRSNYSGDSTFDGQISEFFMANTELRAEEVFGLYSNNSSFFYGLNDNNWRHYAWTIANNSLYNTPSNVKISNTYNSITMSTWKLYVNGVLTKTLSNMNFPNNISRISNYICGSNTATDPSFNGALDDFRMYKSVLSDADIESIYKNPSFSNTATTSTMKNDNIVSSINDNKWRHLTWSIDTSANWKVYINGDLYSKFKGVYPNNIERYLNFFGKLSKNPDTIDSSYSTFKPNTTAATTNTWTNNGITWTSSASSFWQTTFTHDPYRAFNTSTTNDTGAPWHIANNTSYDGWDGLYNRITYSTNVVSCGLIYGEWLQIQSSIPLVMKSYILSSRNGAFIQMPRQYYIVGSNDQSNWYPIQYVMRQISGTATANTVVATPTLFVNTGYYSDDTTSNGIAANSNVYGYPTSINTYTYFRIIVTQSSANSGGDTLATGDGRYVAIGEWNITFANAVSKNFAGALDDFRMYKRVLTDTEVAKMATVNPLYFHYRFDQSDVNSQSLANMATGSPIYDASLSTTGLINTTDFKTGNASLALTTDEQEYPPAPITADTTFIYTGSYGQGRYDVSYSSQFGTATNENANKVFSKVPVDTWSANQWTTASPSYASLSSIYSTNNALGHTGTFNTVVSGISISGEWIQLKMPNAIVLNKYMIIGEINRSMNSFVLAGSNDGNTWSLIDEQRNLGVWSLSYPNCTMYFTPSSVPPSYNHFRLIPTSIASTAAITINFATIRQIKYFAKPEQYVTLPSFWSGYNGLTFTTWFKLNAVSNKNPYFTSIFEFAESNAGISGGNNSIYADIDGNILYFSIFNGSAQSSLGLDLSMNDNVWRHMAWTVDTNGFWKIYINGRLAKTESKSYPNNIQRYANYLGRGIQYNTQSNLNGCLDDFRMYKSVLTDQEVMALYKESNKLLIHYTFDKETVNGSSVGDMVGTPAQLSIANGLDFKNTIISPNSTNATTANMNGWTTTYDGKVYNWQASASSTYQDGVWLPNNAFDTNLTNTFHISDTGSNTLYNTTTGIYAGDNKTNIQSMGNIGGEWLQINCDVPIVLSSYYLVGRYTNPNQFPRSYYIVGSNDGINWYPLQYSTRIGSISGSGNTGAMWTYTTGIATGSRTSPIINMTPYSYDIIPNNGSSTLVFKMRGYSYANNPYTMFRMIFTESVASLTITLAEWYIYAYEPLPSQPIYGSELTPTTYYANSNVETGIWANDGVNWSSSSSSQNIRLNTNDTHGLTYYNTKPFNGRNGVGSGVYQGWYTSKQKYATTNVATNSYTGTYNTYVQTVGSVLGEYLQINSNIQVQISNYYFTTLCSTAEEAGRYLPQEYYIVGSLDGSSQWFPIQYVNCKGGSTANANSPQNTDIYYTTTKLGETQAIASKVSGTSGSTIDIYNYPVYALGYYTSFRVIVKNTFGNSYGLTNATQFGDNVGIGQWNIKFTPHIINPYKYRLGNSSLNLQASYSEFLTIPTIQTLGTDGISFSLWVSTDGTQEGSQIMELGNGYNNNNIMMYISNGNLYFGINNGNSSNTISHDSMIATKILDGNWRNIVVLISIDGTWTFYVNGQFVKTVAGVYPADVPRYINYLGKSSLKMDPYFNGYIDDFRVYRTVLTTTDIAEIYNSTSTSSLDANGLTGFEYNGIDFSKLYKRKYTESAGIITTIAGGGVSRGDGGLATSASFGPIYDIALDNSNNYIYFSLVNDNYVRKIDASGIITTIVGTGVKNSSGDGGLAINASVNAPSGLSLDSSMNLYIAERDGNRIRKIDISNGTISTIAGTIQPIATTTTDTSGNTVSNWVVSDISFTASMSSILSNSSKYKAGNGFIYGTNTYDTGVHFERPATVTYNQTTGVYVGTRNTTGLPASMGLTANTLSGDWLQLYSSQPVRMISYNLSSFYYFTGLDIALNMPQSYYILGSNDRVSWYPIQKVDCSYMSIDVSSICPTLTYNVTTNYGVQQIGPNPVPNSIGYGAYLNYSYADNSYNYFRISFQRTFGQNGGGPGTGAPTGWGFTSTFWNGNCIAIGKWAINFQADCAGTKGSYGDGMLAIGSAINTPQGIRIDSSNNIYISEAGGNRIRKIDASSGIITSILGYISPNSALATTKNWLANGTMWDASSSSVLPNITPYAAYKAFDTANGGNGVFLTNDNLYNDLTVSNPTSGGYIGSYLGTVNTRVIGFSQTISGEWIQIHSGTPCQFISHNITTYSDGGQYTANNLPAKYKIVGSIDASSWYLIQDISLGYSSVSDTTSAQTTQTYVVSTNSSTMRYGTPGAIGDVYLTGYGTAANYYTYFRLIAQEIIGKRMGVTNSATAKTRLQFAEWNINFLGGGGYGGAPAATASSTGDLSLNGTIIGGIAGNATMNYPWGLAFDTSRNLYVAENSGHRIRKLLTDPAGIISSMSPITTICGNGTMSHTGDGRFAINATIGKPIGIDIDTSNNILLGFDDSQVTAGSVIRMINGNNGIIDKIAGTGSSGYSGDGGFATQALLWTPYIARFDKNRNIYIGDASNGRIRKITRQTAPPATNLLRNGVDIANTFSPKTGITTTQLINGIYNTNLQDNIEPIEQQAIPAKGRVFTDNNSWVVPANPVYVSGVSPNNTNATSNTWTTTAGSSTITWNSTASNTTNGFNIYKAFNTTLTDANDAWSSTTNLYDTTTGNYISNTYTYINGIGNVGGEWLQVQTNLPLSMNNYQLKSRISGNGNALSRRYYIVGSNDKLTWYQIQYVNRSSNNNGIIGTTSTYAVDTRTNYIDNKIGDSGENVNSDVTCYSTSSDYYTYFRIITIQNCSSATSQASSVSIGEWTIAGTVLTNPTGWQFSASTEDTSMNANAFNAFNNSTTAFWKDICGNYNSNSGNYCDIVSPNSTAATGYSWTANGINWDASASGTSTTRYVYQAFNSTYGTSVYVTSSVTNLYSATTGIYSGNTNTDVQTLGIIYGEWLQIKSSKPCQYLMHNLVSYGSGGDYVNRTLPARYYIVGSNDGNTWYPIQDISYAYSSTPESPASETTQTISMTTNTTPRYYGAAGTIGYASIAGYSTSSNYYTHFRMIIKEIFGSRFGYNQSIAGWGYSHIAEWNLTLRQGSITSTPFTNTIGNPYSSYRFPVPYKPTTILQAFGSPIQISATDTKMILLSYGSTSTNTSPLYSTYSNNTWSTPELFGDGTAKNYLGVTMNSEGTRIAMCGDLSSVFIYSWTTTTPTLIQTIYSGYSTEIRDCAMSADGNRLVISANGAIRFALWNNALNRYSEFRNTLENRSLTYYGIDISKDGNKIVYQHAEATAVANQRIYWATWNGSNYTNGIVIGAPGDTTTHTRRVKFNNDASVIYNSKYNSTSNIYISYYDYLSNSYSAFNTTNSIPKYIASTGSDYWGLNVSNDGKYLYAFHHLNTTKETRTIYRLELAPTNIAEGEWIQVKLPYQLKATNYSIMNRPTTAEKDDLFNEPRIWWLLGSNDGSAWNLVDYRNGTASIGGAMRKFNVNTKDYYSYYRLVIAATSATTTTTSATLAQLFLNGIYNYTDSVITAIGTNYGNVEQILPIPGFDPSSNNFTFNGRSFITSSSSQGSSLLTQMSPFNAFKNINSSGYVKENNNYRWDAGYGSTGFNNAGTNISYEQNAYDATGIYRGATADSTAASPKLSAIHWRTYFYGGNESNTVAAATMTSTTYTVPRANIISLSMTADNTRVVYCVYSVANQGLYFANVDSNGNWSGETSFYTTQTDCHGITLSADGSRGVFNDYNNGIYYFTWTGSTYTTPIQIESKYNRKYLQMRITADGNRLVYISGDSTGGVYFSQWNGSGFGPLIQTLETRILYYRGIELSNDGNRLVYGTSTNTLHNYNNVFYSVWNGTNYTMGKQTLDTSAKVWRNFAFSNDNNILYGSTQGNATATLWVSKYNSIQDNYEPFIAVPGLTIPTSLDAWPLFMSRDGNTLYCKGYISTTLYRMSTQLYQAAGEWIQAQSSSPLKLTNYRILSRNNDDASEFRYDNKRVPLVFYMLGSNDGSTWYLLDAQSLTTTQTSRELGSYSTSTTYATQYYTYFRLVVNKVSGNASVLSLTNVQLFGVYL